MDLGLVFVGAHRRGGVERSVWEFARHARALGHDVTVYAADIDPTGLDGVRLVTVAPRGPGLVRPAAFAAAARQALRGHRHDHVISFGVGDVGADVLWVNSVHRAWLRRSLSVRGEHGVRRLPWLRYASPRHGLLLAMEHRYFTRPTTRTVVVVAEAVGADLHRLYGVDPARVRVVPNGFDPGEFSPARRAALRAQARAELGYADDDVVALIVANELPRKGFDVLVEAVAATGEPRLRVLLAGRAAPGEADRARIAVLGMAGRVHYAGSTADVGRLHAAADLFVLPTQYEAFCLAIVEALASGLPVITTTVPGAGDRVTADVDGMLLADPRDVPALTEALRAGLDDSRRNRWSAAAPEAVADLAWSELVERGLDLIGRQLDVPSPEKKS